MSSFSIRSSSFCEYTSLKEKAGKSLLFITVALHAQNWLCTLFLHSDMNKQTHIWEVPLNVGAHLEHSQDRNAEEGNISWVSHGCFHTLHIAQGTEVKSHSVVKFPMNSCLDEKNAIVTRTARVHWKEPQGDGEAAGRSSAKWEGMWRGRVTASAAVPVLSGRTGVVREEVLALFWETEQQWGF